MHPSTTVANAVALVRAGRSVSEVARATGASRSSIRAWCLHDGRPKSSQPNQCPICGGRPDTIPGRAYAYLLGQYLGDGMLSAGPRGVYRLRIACAAAWPGVTAECVNAIRALRPDKVVSTYRRPRERVVDVGGWWKHWVCLFPQHGVGAKHQRRIELERWQGIILDSEPDAFLRGLFHSDGCRALNRVNGYVYPRYFLSNMSTDILRLAGLKLDMVGVEWRYNRFNSISVARRASVALLDQIVGPKY